MMNNANKESFYLSAIQLPLFYEGRQVVCSVIGGSFYVQLAVSKALA